MKPLDIPYIEQQKNLRLRQAEQGLEVFDPIRKKWLVLQPEELLRQLVLSHLIHEKKYSPTRIRTEQVVLVNQRPKRADIVVYDAELKPWMIVECKSPKVPVGFSTFEQAAMYNMVLEVGILVVTNGIETYICQRDMDAKEFGFLEDFPTLY